MCTCPKHDKIPPSAAKSKTLEKFEMNKLVVLISGRGSNLGAMCASGLANQISCVISNSPTAAGLETALKYNIPTHIIDHKKYHSREEFDQKLAKCIDEYAPRLVALAGFMRILTPWFVDHYKNRLINIHPSLLPAFVGATAQSDAIKTRVKVSGATVHFVTNDLDMGPIIAQGVVPVLAHDTTDALKARILELEHVIYQFVIKKILANQVQIIDDSETTSSAVIVGHDIGDATLLGKFINHIFY